MGEFAEMALASRDPCDEFELSGGPGDGYYVPPLYESSYRNGVGKLEYKAPNLAVINGRKFSVTDKASRFLMYIRDGTMVYYRYNNGTDDIYFIRKV